MRKTQPKGEALRDRFAGLAMQAIVGSITVSREICDSDPRYTDNNFAEVVARNAYEFADAMLLVRRGGK